MTGSIITSYVAGLNKQNLKSFVILEVSLCLSNFLGRYAVDHTNIDNVGMYSLGEPFQAIIISSFLLLVWTRSRRKAGLPLNQPLLLDEASIVTPFIPVAIFVTGLVSIIDSAIYYNLSLDVFLDSWCSEGVGIIITLPAVLLVSQSDWRHRLKFTWMRAATGTFLAVTVVAIPIVVSFVFETADLAAMDPGFKVSWSVLFSLPVLALSSVLLGTTGLTCNLLLFSIATPMIRFLPGDSSQDDHLLSLMILLIDLTMLPFFVLLADRNRLLASVERQVEDRTVELRRANREKTEFMSFLCHELRNPLHVVLSMADMTLTENPGNEYAKASITAATYMTDLCNDVLDATKLKNGKTSIEPHWVDLSSLLKQQCVSFSLHAATLGINLQCHCDVDVPDRLYTDDLRWRQCITNLLANACRFTKTGGSVDFYLQRLKDGSLASDHVRLRCEVVDTGIGIDPSHLPTLFVPFNISSQQTTREYQGSGLGLSVSAMLIELMGGKLNVESQRGKGTRFWFELIVMHQPPSPALQANIELEGVDLGITEVAMMELKNPSAALEIDTSGGDWSPPLNNSSWTAVEVDVDDVERTSAQSEPTPMIPSTPDHSATSSPLPLDRMMINDITPQRSQIPIEQQPESIDQQPGSESSDRIIGALVVDDSDVNRALLKRMLQRLRPDMELHTANDGQEAIDLAERHKYHIIFMDLQMPRVDGWQAIGHIRKEGLNTNTPIVITTANTVTDEANAIGRCSVLSKPFLTKDLKRALDRHI
ncbi:hypothetical protein SmJEL517_g01008 [Synchytrium microbalum]|uniref:histidine kinase n=1 Tax=Synchytrium microbalum TaxID=1806994 RepID=A0A507CCR8_9FUNG|nr:uncharacterized protein SmJEL517_g01008 [Synchytrium microbalum]TPX36969.1 hypothetical protein SmJEL517_g01008 [Synchytrium microbalum]